MVYNSNQSKLEKKLTDAKLKLSIVKLDVNNNRVRLRCRQTGITFSKHVAPYTLEGIESALSIAKEIESDIYRRVFDPTLVKYGLAKASDPKLTEIVNLPVNLEPTLKEIWDIYKAAKASSVAPRTKEVKWYPIDNWFVWLPSECLILTNADKLLSKLRTKYSDGTLKPLLVTLNAAVNLSIKLGKPIKSNTIAGLLELLVLPPKKEIKSYSSKEIATILKAFYDGRFDKDSSVVSSTYYAGFVEFRFLTGCRPSEAIALTWSDIKLLDDDKCQVIFSKRVAGMKDKSVQAGTKNGVQARIFPGNKQLRELIDSLDRIPNEGDLVFPSHRSRSVIDTHNFNLRWWQPIIKELVRLGE
ncbi:hypothetical protein NWP17_00025, partial [Chrysosporum bergii ANA360D]